MTNLPSSPQNGAKAVLLVGGMGTRLRTVVPSTPKSMASVGSRAFLELLVHQLRHQGFRRLVMCTGYLADQIESAFGNGHEWEVEIEYSREAQPMGTAGALRLARPYLADALDFLVLNGDSFLEVDFHTLLRFHQEQKGIAVMAVRQVRNAGRYGTVRMDECKRVTGFEEKTDKTFPGLVNAGVYVFSRAVLENIPEGQVSLEIDVFPKLLGHGIYAMEQHGMFIDIGTREDYARAQELCDRLYEAAAPD
jgi:NDP-sugar pyrophosphorylase family protein